MMYLARVDYTPKGGLAEDQSPYRALVRVAADNLTRRCNKLLETRAETIHDISIEGEVRFDWADYLIVAGRDPVDEEIEREEQGDG